MKLVHAEYKTHCKGGSLKATATQARHILSAVHDLDGSEEGRTGAEICRDIVRWAFKGDGHALYLRGDNDRGKTYLSIESLLQPRTRDDRRMLSAEWLALGGGYGIADAPDFDPIAYAEEQAEEEARRSDAEWARMNGDAS